MKRNRDTANPKDARFNWRVRSDLRRKLEAIALVQGVSLPDLGERALTEWADGYLKKHPEAATVLAAVVQAQDK